MQAIGACTARHFAGFVFSGKTELEQLGRTLCAFAVVQGQGSDRQLRAGAELFDQRLLQRADHQLHAIGLGLAIELVEGRQARAVIELDRWRLLPGLLGLVVSSHETFAQCPADRGQRAILWQQQGDFAQGLAGQFLELGQWQRQLNGGGVLWILGAPVVDRGLLLFQGAGSFHRLRQAHPAAEVVGGARLQLIGRQRGDQCPDRFVVFAGGFTFKHWRDEDALPCGGQCLAIGFKGAGMDGASANLLLDRQFAQALQARMTQGCQRRFGLIANHGQFSRQGTGENLWARLECFDGDLLQDLRGLAGIPLAIGQVCRAQAQQGGFFRVFAFSGLCEQLLDTGIRGPWKFAKAGGGRAGASRQQGSKAEGSEQPQASDHVVFLILDQISVELYPSTGRGAMLLV